MYLSLFIPTTDYSQKKVSKIHNNIRSHWRIQGGSHWATAQSSKIDCPVIFFRTDILPSAWEITLSDKNMDTCTYAFFSYSIKIRNSRVFNIWKHLITRYHIIVVEADIAFQKISLRKLNYLEVMLRMSRRFVKRTLFCC